MALPPLTELVACPHCDTLHSAAALPEGASASCQRCHAVLQTARPGALVSVVSLAISAMVLMVAAISFPFMDLNVSGNHNATSVFNAIAAFNAGLAMPLAVAVALFIIILPLTRLIAIVYAISPLIRGASPRPLARQAFGLAETLRPWAMAEIFMVGVTVALIKVAGMASVTLGPAFYAFAALVVITVFKDQLMNRYAIWEALDKATPAA
ncbi:paraquat-inducible protein A [Yoonia sp. R2331]|uniref:paraquat-inducible protein A n=1 Tax=Yoonia sp. R2331 TaxID=3237238 RepID=UPI0034E5648F